MLQHIEYKDKKPKILGDDYMVDDSVYCMMYDKCLRNMGYMKPPKIITLPDDSSSRRDGDFNVYMRYIILRAYLEPQKTYYLRFQVMGTETSHFNYSTVEIVPKSVYDNPNRAEDVW